MNKQFRNTLAVVLTICLLLSMMPVSVLSVEEESNSVTQTQTIVTEEGIAIVREETSLRGEYEKHFLMSDGTYQVVVYSYPVHDLVNGIWVDIENTNQNARGDVATDNTQQNIIDNYVLEGSGVQNYNQDRLYIGNKSGGRAQAYIQFATMPTLPEGATITAATMTVNMVSGTSTAYNASAYQVTGGEWTSGSIQWSNKPAANVLLEENISHNNKTKYQFSCISAVRHWYDEDTTGQNENYGIVLSYYDEAVADYNAVYSADCTDVSKRPSLTISYDPQKISIKEGQTCNLATVRATGSVSWTSSNASIATVSNTGVVTGIKAGCATITARMNGTIVKEYTVFVKLYAGVFYIQNKSTGYYLSTEEKGFNSGTGMIQSTLVSNTSEGLWQIWRITYMDDGCYTIRPMHKPNMGLSYTDAVELQDIGTSYSMTAVENDALWTISYGDGGYEISNYGQPSYSLCSVNSQCDTEVTAATSSSAPIYRWVINPVSVGTDLIMYTLDTEKVVSQPRRGVAPGQIRTIEDINLAFAVSSMATLNQVVYWESTNESVAKVNYFTGVVTGVSVGETQIRGTAWVNGLPYQETYTLVVSAIPISGSELPYEPELWNSNPFVKIKTNCYAYAFNNQVCPGTNDLCYMQPGEFAIEDLGPLPLYGDYVYAYVVEDSKALGFMFEPIGKYDCCPTGAYKVALYMAPGVDYHWYRQNPDGTWSHKLASDSVTLLDASGNIITDPDNANRVHTANYWQYIGYYAVTPINNMYDSSSASQSTYEEQDDAQQMSGVSYIGGIEEGMTHEAVVAEMGEPDIHYTSSARIEGYTLCDGRILIIEYTEDNGNLIVDTFKFEGGSVNEAE